MGRPLLVFAVLLLGPAFGFGLLGWRSVEREHEFRLHDMNREGEDALETRVAQAAAALEQIRETESRRHYFEYQDAYLPQERVTPGLAFQKSPLTHKPSDPRVLGWFQWELYSGRAVYGEPEVFPSEDLTLRKGLAQGYRDALRVRLEDAPSARDLKAGRGRTESYPHWNVAGNEERGKLQEELGLQQRAPAAPAAPQSGYLGAYERRAREAPIQVRYTDFRYLARGATAKGPPLIAWRLVWIPREQSQWREVKRDRYLVQGYALEPRSLFPARWESVGRALLIRGDAIGDWSRPGFFHGSLAEAISAEPAGAGVRAAIFSAGVDPTMMLVSRADQAVAEKAWQDARNRFLLLVGGLVFVVAIGFYVLVRSLRREMGLVQRKEDFIAAITHELKTPLTGIRMYADMLREGWVATPDAAEQYATRILDETERLGHLVDQVLDLAALERGVAALNAQVGDLGEAVGSAVQLMESKADEAGVALSTTIEPELPAVTFDPRLVRPLVLNLLDNAIKYSAKADVKSVEVGLRRDGERVELVVADRGQGMDAATRRRVFEPFQRAAGELTREAAGVGIGLALVKRYADAHNARVVVESVRGHGTTVRVRFRL